MRKYYKTWSDWIEYVTLWRFPIFSVRYHNYFKQHIVWLFMIKQFNKVLKTVVPQIPTIISKDSCLIYFIFD